MLMGLAESKAVIFKSDIEKDLSTGKASDSLTIPITKVVQSKVEFRGITSTTPKDSLLEEITKSLENLFAGDGKLLDGISGLVKTALDILIGTGKGEESEIRLYTVIAEYPAIVRYDFAFWCRNIEAASIYEQMQNAFACVAYKSAVDVAKLDFNTFLTIYQQILVSAYGDDKKKLEKMIEQAEAIYKRFTNIPHSPVLSMDTSLSSAASPVIRELKPEDMHFAPFITHFRKMEK